MDGLPEQARSARVGREACDEIQRVLHQEVRAWWQGVENVAFRPPTFARVARQEAHRCFPEPVREIVAVTPAIFLAFGDDRRPQPTPVSAQDGPQGPISTA